jgi:hypothetical protein
MAQLDLAENVRIVLTREEWAVLLIALTHLGVMPDTPRATEKIADRLSDLIQEHAAPVGVLTRVVSAHAARG